MQYLTDRKRAEGMGSAKSGTAHFWKMKVSSAVLMLLIPLFVGVFGSLVGQPYENVIISLSNPIVAVLMALTFIVGLNHFKGGVETLIEDYVHGGAQKIALIVMASVSYGLMAFAVFAIARIAL